MDNYGSIYSMTHLLVQLHQVKMVLQLVDGQEASKQSEMVGSSHSFLCMQLQRSRLIPSGYD